MLKWVLIAVGVIAGLFLAMTIAGSLMPANHVVSVTTTLHQPVSAIWEAVSNYENLPSWRSDLTEVKRLPDQNGHEVWLEIGEFGEQPLEVMESIPNQRLVMKIADENLPYGGTWTLEFSAVPGGTALKITEDGFVEPPLMRFMARKLMGEDFTIKSYLIDLGKKFGEELQFK